ncbi:bifunctional methylenetetrahydrofolate dehydrogenase/cyclohydrolase, mitochondrial-like isoform X1 [Watersipora subatra]|uniref:bifunctional methylenetetrahydrofolate dehydrogenase/cyclohydrolase, mitochondrial-like isoform X1 n=1 Tax=Watersipora subatra TaxID=2589382 RepID=UPI00355B165B
MFSQKTWLVYGQVMRCSGRSISISSQRPKAQIIDGKKIAETIRNEVKIEVEKMLAEGKRAPYLAAIQVGADPASATYIKNKMKAAASVGIESTTITLDPSVSEAELLQLIKEKDEDSSVDGILVQLPVPQHIGERAVCNAVSPAKDVDGFNVVSVGKFCQDLKCLLPATPAGVMELLRRTGVETFGKNAVVAGRSKNVGMPIAMLLHADGIGETQAGDATTTICHRYTPPEQLRHFVKYADIVVVAAGIPGLITGDMLKPGCAVIDVGINRIKDPETGKNKIVGDCDFDSCSEVAGWITPVPGGVGPMTVAMLMKNTLQAAQGAYKKP